MYVIVNADGAFWDGGAWVQEYPDAQEFATLHSAKREVVSAAKTAACEVRRDYGLESERVAYRAERWS